MFSRLDVLNTVSTWYFQFTKWIYWYVIHCKSRNIWIAQFWNLNKWNHAVQTLWYQVLKSILCLLDSYILLPLVANSSFSMLHKIALWACATVDLFFPIIDGNLGKLQFGLILNNESINMFLVIMYVYAFLSG